MGRRVDCVVCGDIDELCQSCGCCHECCLCDEEEEENDDVIDSEEEG